MSTLHVEIQIHDTLCIRCSKCIKACPAKILRLPEDETKPVEVIVSKLSECFECRICEAICPKRAIYVDGIGITQENQATARVK